MKMREIEALTGKKGAQAFEDLRARFEKRIWRDEAGRIYKTSVMTPQYLTLRHLGEKTEKGVPFKAARISLDDALDCISGNFQEYVYKWF